MRGAPVRGRPAHPGGQQLPRSPLQLPSPLSHTLGTASWGNLSLSQLSRVAHTSCAAVPGVSSRSARPLVSGYLCRAGPAFPVDLNLCLILGYLLVTRSGRCSHTATPPCLIWGTRTLLGGSFLVLSLFWRRWEVGSGETCLSQPGPDTTPESSGNHWGRQPRYGQPNAIYL